MKTFRQIADLAGVPESTLRQYRDAYEAFLPARGEGRRRRYDEASAERLCQIARWKRDGLAHDSIVRALGERDAPAVRRHRRDADERHEELLRALRAQSEQIARLEAEVQRLRGALQPAPARFFEDTIDAS